MLSSTEGLALRTVNDQYTVHGSERSQSRAVLAATTWK